MVKIAYQLHNPFRDAGFQRKSLKLLVGKNVIPLLVANWKYFWIGRSSDPMEFLAVTHEFPQCFFDSLIHDFLVSNLDHCNVTPPRTGLNLRM